MAFSFSVSILIFLQYSLFVTVLKENPGSQIFNVVRNVTCSHIESVNYFELAGHAVFHRWRVSWFFLIMQNTLQSNS